MLSRITTAGADVFALLAFANLLHEDLGRAQPEQKAAIASGILHHARFHGDLHRMTRVGRDDAPADDDRLGLGGDHRGHRGGGTRLHPVFAPPGISFGQPENIETGAIAGLRHAHRLL